ncbi:hypothetical protein III_03281 [Bacillus mycoides]|uniref:Uncharacterized protein n=1 Tax=Bacillus mycoides TaxID=1405 RepID=A0ABC9R429_BACMY|nr:hypothetical protein III_03281 [Bacillus mycoides]
MILKIENLIKALFNNKSKEHTYKHALKKVRML